MGVGVEPGDGGPQVGEEVLGEVVAEPLATDDTEHGQVLAVGGEGVGGNLPPSFAKGPRNGEDVPTLDHVALQIWMATRSLITPSGGSKVDAAEPSVPDGQQAALLRRGTQDAGL